MKRILLTVLSILALCMGVSAAESECETHQWEMQGYPEDPTNYHCYVCSVCGMQTGMNIHWVDCKTGKCELCGQENAVGQAAHYTSDNSYEYDAANHWQICDVCGEKYYFESHYVSCTTGTCNECGQTDAAGWIVHRLSWDQWVYDENKCWLICEDCGDVCEESEHDVRCDTGVCNKCGQSDVNGLRYHGYTSLRYEADQTQHWTVCMDCGEISSRQDHQISCTGDYCTVCGITEVTGSVNHLYDWKSSLVSTASPSTRWIASRVPVASLRFAQMVDMSMEPPYSGLLLKADMPFTAVGM